MLVKDLKDMQFYGMKVCVSWTFNKGYDWEDLLKAPDYEAGWVWDSEVVAFTKTELYDLVIKIR